MMKIWGFWRWSDGILDPNLEPAEEEDPDFDELIKFINIYYWFNEQMLILKLGWSKRLHIIYNIPRVILLNEITKSALDL
jgi:hypothetical protein